LSDVCSMQLSHGLHLAYCTNIHRGETWSETFGNLQRYTLAVRDQVCANAPYAVGLRLSNQASHDLSQPSTLASFRQWLDEQNCYVFTINGFPYGRFHGARVKEQVYAPDWTTLERVEYTNRLFDILAQLLPEGLEGSVSTVPVSFKEFIRDADQVRVTRENLWRCVEHVAETSQRTGRKLHLGLEPEPLCYLENTEETVRYFDQLRSNRPHDSRLDEHLGVNYDCCHLAVEFEQPADALRGLRDNGIKISKIHLSSALKVRPTTEARHALKAFADDIYFHQVIERRSDGTLTRYKDLDAALASTPHSAEWRIHFHIPLHSQPMKLFDHTSDHILGLLDLWKREPEMCSHMEMETYTWEVMPPEMKNRNVVDQLVSEYRWTLAELEKRGVHPQR
jgi:hypothetical protein